MRPKHYGHLSPTCFSKLKHKKLLNQNQDLLLNTITQETPLFNSVVRPIDLHYAKSICAEKNFPIDKKLNSIDEIRAKLLSSTRSGDSYYQTKST